jgi:hypothetical protein
MRNVLFGLLIILFAAIVTKAPGAQTSSSAESGGIRTVTATTSGCDATANTVRVSSRRIVAAGRFTCANPGPDGLTMTVALQKQAAGGKWTTIAAQKFGAAGETTTRARSNTARTHSVSAACARGVYRTTTTVVSVKQKKSSTTVKSSSPRTNPCG